MNTHKIPPPHMKKMWSLTLAKWHAFFSSKTCASKQHFSGSVEKDYKTSVSYVLKITLSIKEAKIKVGRNATITKPMYLLTISSI